MKKGLLSLLALALTVVGCQNYDDQFDELTSQITSLQTTVDGLTGVSSAITTLQTTVAGISTAVNGLSNYDDTGIVAQLNAVSSTLATLLTQLDGVATNADLAAISSTLADVKSDVRELLEANAVINQNITITNLATLEYVESLISTDEDDPNVIVNGSITVEVATADFTDAQVARVNAVAAKFATSLATVTLTNTYSPTTSINFSNLAFIDGNAILSGSTNLANADTSDDVLRTVSGDLTISNQTGGLDLSLLTSAGNTVVPTTISSLNLGNATLGSITSTGSSSSELYLPKATTVNTGKGAISHLSAALASDVDVTAAATATINTPKALTLDVLGAGKSFGYISLTGAVTTVAKFTKLTTTGTITTNNIAELHLPLMTTVSTFTSGAKVMDLSKLASQRDASTFTFTKLAALYASKLNVSGTVSVTVATSIDVEDTDAGYEFGAPAATSLTIRKLADTNSFETTGTAYDFGKLTTLNVTGVADSAPSIGSQTNTVSSTSAVLANVTVDGTIDEVKIYTGTKLASVNTDGFIRHFELRNGGTSLTAVTIDHDHIEGSDAATFIVDGNSKLAGLTPSALDEVGIVTISNNPALTALDLSSLQTLPQLGTYSITLDANNLSGNYVLATEIVTTTAARDERIRSAALATLKPIMALAAASNSVTYTMVGDLVTNVTTSTRSNINDDIVATSTNTETLEDIISWSSGLGTINVSTNVVTTVQDEDFVYVESL